MTTRPLTIAVLLSLLAPLAARAQGADKPAAPPAAPAPAPKVTWDLGGWLVLNSWSDSGALNAADLPRYAVPIKHEKATGMSVRQSRLRASIGVPDDGGLLGGAVLKGFVETDFVGGYVNGDESAPILRLRHAYVTATWKELGNFSVLVGQTADIFHGPLVPQTLSHLATPRFAGAGYLYRRAPQVRLSGEVGKDVAVLWTLGVISSSDKTNQLANGTSVGYRAFMPDLEGRLAFAVRGSSSFKMELGAGGRYAQEKYLMAGLDGTPNRTVKSQAVAVDLKLDFGPVVLIGGAFSGENLDVANSLAPGVLTTATSGNLTSVKSISTKGGWGQLQLLPVKPLMICLGGGVETPKKKHLPATIALGTGTMPAIDRNLQYSGGLLLNLTSRWRIGVEATHYETHGLDRKTTRADQFELSSLLSL